MAFSLAFDARRRHRRSAFILVAATLLACASDVSAEEMDADRARARVLMAEGRARQRASDLRGALESFRAADSLLHFPTTGLELARAEADLGLLMQSRETLKRLLDSPAPSDELPQFKKARVLAAGLLVEIERTIPTMRIVVLGAPPGTGFAVAVDGVTLALPAVAGPQPMNPGHHVVVATSSAGDAKQEVDLAAHEAKEITLTLTRGAPPVPSNAGWAAPAPVSAPVPLGDGSSDMPAPASRDRTLVYVGLGAACAGATVSVIAGLSSLSHTRSAEDGCVDGRCPPSTHDDLHAAHTYATVANVSLIVAGAGVGAAIVGLLQKPRSPSSASRALTPWVGLGAAGLDGKF